MLFIQFNHKYLHLDDKRVPDLNLLITWNGKYKNVFTRSRNKMEKEEKNSAHLSIDLPLHLYIRNREKKIR